MSLRKSTTRSERAAAAALAVVLSAHMFFPDTGPVLCLGFAPMPSLARGMPALRNDKLSIAAAPHFHVDTRLHATSKPMEIWLDARQDVRGDTAVPPSRLSDADAIILGSDDDSPPSSSTALEAYYLIDRPRPETGEDLPPLLFRDDTPVGALVDVSDPSGQDKAMGLVGSVEWIVVTCNGDSSDGSSPGDDDGSGGNDDQEWFMIPAENLISACQGTGTKIAALVQKAGDVGGLSRALELGVDALFVEALADKELWNAALEARQERSAGSNYEDDDAAADAAQPSIVQGRCRRLQAPGGKSTVIAERVCIDLVQSLKPSEGCWVGSSAKVTALVLSEAAESTYVPSRPFRVNAGPVHSYVVMGDGRSTKYLSELRAGDEVLVYDVETGVERSVAVGRLKVEVRPCVMVGLSVGDKKPRDGKDDDGSHVDGQVFLQQAETVRLGQSLGEESFVRVTDLVGESEDVLLRAVSMGTHVGKAYSGKVIEQ